MFKGKTLVKTFWSNDEGRYLSDTYEVINISSDELVFNTRMKIEKGISKGNNRDLYKMEV